MLPVCTKLLVSWCSTMSILILVLLLSPLVLGQTCDLNLEVGVDHGGSDYRFLPYDLEQCKVACCVDSACFGFSWSATAPNNGAGFCTAGGNCCYLKSNIGVPVAYPIITSGIKKFQLGDAGMPALSCAHILQRRGKVPNSYYFIYQRGAVVPTRCDFDVFPGQAAQLIYKVTAGIGGYPWLQWTTNTPLNENDITLMHVYNSAVHYKSSLVLNNWASIKQVSVNLYKAGVQKQYVRFNSTGKGIETFFSGENVLSSSWTDLPTTAQSNSGGTWFTADGPVATSWYINKVGGACNAIQGWMVLTSGTVDCDTGSTPAKINIQYSTTSTIAYLNQMAYADVMIFWALVEVPIDDKLSLGESPTKPALSCNHLYRKRGVLPTGVYYVNHTDGVVPVVCNFDAFPGRAATLIYKVSNGIAGDPYALWAAQTRFNDLQTELFVVFPQASYAHYVSRFTEDWSKVKQLSLRVGTTRLNNAPDSYVNFNASGTTALNWFTASNVVKSSWSLQNAVFSIAGTQTNTAFQIDSGSASSASTCGTNSGWLVVAGGSTECSASYSFSSRTPATIAFSSTASPVSFAANSKYFADSITIWADLDLADGSESALLGETASNPAYSCNHIRRARGELETGTFYIKTASGVVPVMCDFKMFPNRAATLVYKLSAGVSGDPNQIWLGNSVSNVSTSPEMFNMYSTSGHYISSLLNNNWNRVFQLSARVYSGGVQRQFVDFNPTGTNRVNWFYSTNVVSSSWSDIYTATVPNIAGAFFSIEGVPVVYRAWYINQGYGASCDVNIGWLGISYGPEVCTAKYFNTRDTVAIRYSQNPTANYFSVINANNMLNADAFAVWADLDLEVGVAKLGETPVTAAKSCEHIRLANSNAQNGIYYTKTYASRVVPTFCDFTIFPEKASTMVAKFSDQAPSTSAYTQLVSGTVNPYSGHYLNTKASWDNYVHPNMYYWSSLGGVSKTSVRVYKNSALQQFIDFDSSASTSVNWFAKAKILNTSWMDLTTANTGASGYLFSSSYSSTRDYVISKSSTGSCGETSWLTLYTGTADDACMTTYPFFNIKRSKIVIGYSTLSTASSVVANTFDNADSMAIWATLPGGSSICSTAQCSSSQTCDETLGGCVEICDFNVAFTKPAGQCTITPTVETTIAITGGKWRVQYSMNGAAWVDTFYGANKFTMAMDAVYTILVQNEVGCVKSISAKIKRPSVPSRVVAPTLIVDASNGNIQAQWPVLLYPSETGQVPLNTYTVIYTEICISTNTSTETRVNVSSSVNKYVFPYKFGMNYEVSVFATNCYGPGQASIKSVQVPVSNPSRLAAIITSIPLSTATGGSMTIAGKNFGSTMHAFVDGVDADSICSFASNTLTCSIAPGIGSHNLTIASVETPCSTQSLTLKWAYAAPNVTAVTSLSGLGGNMTITGDGFGPIGTSTKVTIDGITCSNCSVATDHTSIYCQRCPGGQGSGYSLVVQSDSLVSKGFPITYPVCDPVCVYGECVADGVCKCADGYGSVDCSEEQFCDGTLFKFSSCGNCGNGLCCHFEI